MSSELFSRDLFLIINIRSVMLLLRGFYRAKAVIFSSNKTIVTSVYFNVSLCWYSKIFAVLTFRPRLADESKEQFTKKKIPLLFAFLLYNNSLKMIICQNITKGCRGGILYFGDVILPFSVTLVISFCLVC